MERVSSQKVIGNSLRARVVEVNFSRRPYPVNSCKAVEDITFSFVKGIRSGGGLKIQANNHFMIAGRSVTLQGDVAQALSIEGPPNLVQGRRLGKLHIDERSAAKVNPVNQPPMNSDGYQPGQSQGQRQAYEQPLFPHPVNIGLVKQLHRSYQAFLCQLTPVTNWGFQYFLYTEGFPRLPLRKNILKDRPGHKDRSEEV